MRSLACLTPMAPLSGRNRRAVRDDTNQGDGILPRTRELPAIARKVPLGPLPSVKWQAAQFTGSAALADALAARLMPTA